MGDTVTAEREALYESLRSTPLCQRWDEAELTLALPAETEEWADEVLLDADVGEVSRDKHGVLLVKQTIGGNCGAVEVAKGWLDDIADALRDVDIDPAHLILRVDGKPGTAK